MLEPCLTVTGGINDIKTSLIRDHSQAILEASPVEYLKSATACGSLFDHDVTDGTTSSVNTGFFVDHTEPLEALEDIRMQVDWPLGDLLDGHEFLLVLEAKPRSRARSRTLSQNESRPLSGAL